MGLIEHEVPEHELVHLLELRARTSRSSRCRSQGLAGRGQARREARAAGRLAADLRDAERRVGDRGRRDRAPPGRPGSRDPPAGQGRRAATGSAQAVKRADRGDRGAPRGRVCARAPRPSAAQLAATPYLRGLDSPLYLASAPGEPDNLYVVEQPGVIRVAARGSVRAKPFLDIRRSSRRGRAGAALGRVPSEVRDEPQVLRRLHGHRTATRASSSTGRTAAARRSACGSSSSSSSRTRTTTAASSSSGPTGSSTSAWATAARAAIRRTARRTWPAGSASCCASTSTRARRRSAIAGYGLRNPWRFSLRQARRRPLHRRRRPERVGGDRLHAALEPGPGELRLERLRGHARLQTSARTRRASRRRRSPSTATPRLLGHRRLRLPRQGVPSAGTLLLRRLLLAATIWSLQDRRRQGDRRPRGVDHGCRASPPGASTAAASSTPSRSTASSTARRRASRSGGGGRPGPGARARRRRASGATR